MSRGRSLTPAQQRAIAHVQARAEAARGGAVAALHEIFTRAGLPRAALEGARDLPRRAPITLSFHPDRLLAGGDTVAEALLAEGRYRSQFETGISNGSRTAFPGGERDLWEQALFGGAYREASAAERPRYGGLNVMRYGDGACPRFGSCHFVLREHVIPQTTFTWGDSHQGPEHVGTAEAFEPVLAALLASVREQEIADLLRLLRERGGARGGEIGRALDTYIEAQVHADLSLAEDVEALVIDPSFTGTETGDTLSALAARYGISLRAHPGFVIATGAVPADFRGPRMIPLAARIDERYGRSRGEIDAALIGRAAAALHRDPESWADWGSYEEALQHLKQMWHILVAFGRSA